MSRHRATPHSSRADGCPQARTAGARLADHRSLGRIRRGPRARLVSRQCPRGGGCARGTEQIRQDPQGFVARLVDREAKGPPILFPDGSTARRLPGYRLWLWDGEFCGSIGLRWQRGHRRCRHHVLGQSAYAVVPWKRRLGCGHAGPCAGATACARRRFAVCANHYRSRQCTNPKGSPGQWRNPDRTVQGTRSVRWPRRVLRLTGSICNRGAVRTMRALTVRPYEDHDFDTPWVAGMKPISSATAYVATHQNHNAGATCRSVLSRSVSSPRC